MKRSFPQQMIETDGVGAGAESPRRFRDRSFLGFGVPGLKLQSIASLASGGSWHNVEAAVEEIEGESHVRLGPSERDQFFRPSVP